MIYKILADTVVLIHFLWIVFLILGALWGRRSRTVKVLHISGLVFAVFIQVFDIYCPLTYLEVWLRAAHDPALSYTGSFIVHYIEKLVYIELSSKAIFVLSILLCGFNGWVYLRRGK